MNDVKTKVTISISIILLICYIIYYIINTLQIHNLNIIRVSHINSLLLQTIKLVQVKKQKEEVLENKIKEFKLETADISIVTDRSNSHINKWDLILTTEDNNLCNMLYTSNREKSTGNEEVWTNLQFIDECDKLNKITYTILNNR